MAIFVRDKSFYKSLIALAIPISLQNLIAFAVNFADNLMVGTLGDVAISGVYMGSQIQTILQMFINGTGAAMLILIAQYWGKQDLERIRRITVMCIKIVLGIGVVVSILSIALPTQILRLLTNDEAVVQAGLPYLQIMGISYIFFCLSQILISAMRGVENAKVGMYVSLMSLFVNIFLNWVLIFGHLGFPALGITGAAIATLIARIFECAVMVIYTFFIEKTMHLRFGDLRLKAGVLGKDFIKYGLPVMAGDLVWSANVFGQGIIVGRLSAEAIAASSIMGMMNNLTFIWIMGLSAAVGILTGKTVGRGEFEKMKAYAKTIQVMFLIIGVASGILILLIKGPFISLYDISDQAAIYADQLMCVLSVSIVGTCYQATGLSGLVKSGGDTGFVFKNDSIFVFLVVLPASVLALVLDAPVWVVFACLKCDQVLKCFVAVVKINRFNWMKKLTREVG